MKNSLQEKRLNVPEKPGVYLMKDSEGNIIYVGKAVNLKKRLGNYFNKTRNRDAKTLTLIRKIVDFETIVADSEKEALILESNLIKRHRPRYNVILKDDKRYPSLRLDPREPFPNLTVVRKIQKDGALYFGPYASSQAVKETLKVIHRTFRIRKCRPRKLSHRDRPCLYCQLQGCLAPCCRDVDPADYLLIVKEVILFLKGRTPELLRAIRLEMEQASDLQQFERAAVLRDKMFALERTLQSQVAVTTDFKDRDVVGLFRSEKGTMVTLLSIRGGFLQGKRDLYLEDTLSNDSEIVESFIRQYYDHAHFIPGEIIVPIQLENSELTAEWVSGPRGNKVKIIRPRRGEKAKLLKMGMENAHAALEALVSSRSDMERLLRRLQRKLSMEHLPERIECFDNSNLFGTNPVASMVVFTGGTPDKSGYRRFKIRSQAAPDDYAHMTEVLRRRFEKQAADWPLPNLLVLDGGKGQLNVALSVLAELKMTDKPMAIGIAKPDPQKGERHDKIFLAGRKNPLGWAGNEDLLLFLQRIRDEAHRFAVSYHRRKRTAESLQSELDLIPGIGKKRKTRLLKHFGSVDKIRAASLEELRALPGMNLTAAKNIVSGLNPKLKH